MTVNILLKFPHGLGDCTQFGVVLKHLRRHRPDWNVDVLCGRGKHTALVGLCRRVYHDQEEAPGGPYDQKIDIGWYENYSRYPDRPNTKITNCLREVFGLDYDADLGRYRVDVTDAARHRVEKYLYAHNIRALPSGKYPIVLIHYEGNTSTWKKNLSHWQVEPLVKLIQECGRVPIILDWDRRSPLPDQKTILCPGVSLDDIWGGFGSGDAATIAAFISLSEAFVGIDSGPGKVASSTSTPTLICWRGHHPIQFHDPAENTLHLVPEEHYRLPPIGEDGREMIAYFHEHYQFATYRGEHGLVSEALDWLGRILGREKPGRQLSRIAFAMPNGIGDCAWALTKIQNIAQGRPIDIALTSCDPKLEIERRAVPFLKRFSFIRDVTVLDLPLLVSEQEPTDTRGRWRYLSDGMHGGYHYLVPNGPLEAGRRLETWLPQVPVDWDFMSHFDWTGTERGSHMGKGLAPFVAVYLGAEVRGHTDEGHNWKWLWQPDDWVKLTGMLIERGMKIVLIGANYDRSFWERYVKEKVEAAGQFWHDSIGQLEIGETLALLGEAKCLIAYQSGLGIVHHYLGGKGAMWWRPEGDSQNPKHLVTFSEAMKDAWIRPGWEDNWMGLVYKREAPEDIVAEIDKRGWLDAARGEEVNLETR
jgi:hypothetical protein